LEYLVLRLLASVQSVPLYVLALLLTRYSSVAGMVGAIAAPIAAFLLQRVDLAMLFAGLALLVIWKHRANIGRLLKGTEPKVGKSGG
jgi:glycerol-3-phosphate acyltransferase PlsY